MALGFRSTKAQPTFPLPLNTHVVGDFLLRRRQIHRKSGSADRFPTRPTDVQYLLQQPRNNFGELAGDIVLIARISVKIEELMEKSPNDGKMAEQACWEHCETRGSTRLADGSRSVSESSLISAPPIQDIHE